MSDNPTLTLHGDDKLMWVVDRVPVATATRAEVLAALGDKEWWCVDGDPAMCRPPRKPLVGHDGCHWAVKP